MATLTKQIIVEAGIAITYATPAGGGDAFANNGSQFIHVVNANGSTITVTITAATTTADNATFGKLTKSNGSVSIANGASKYIGPFPTVAFNDASGNVVVTCSATSGVTIAVLEAPKI